MKGKNCSKSKRCAKIKTNAFYKVLYAKVWLLLSHRPKLKMVTPLTDWASEGQQGHKRTSLLKNAGVKKIGKFSYWSKHEKFEI